MSEETTFFVTISETDVDQIENFLIVWADDDVVDQFIRQTVDKVIVPLLQRLIEQTASSTSSIGGK